MIQIESLYRIELGTLSFARDVTSMPYNGCRPLKKDVYKIRIKRIAKEINDSII